MTAAKRPVHAPDDHPTVPRRKTGVLLANLGTPDATDYWSMRRYLNEFLSDKRVVDYAAWKWQPLLQLIILTRRPFSSGEAYRSIWNTEKNESPLLTITRDQTDAIRERLTARHEDVMVEFCMRYGNPSTFDVVRKMTEAGCDRILFFPLYPHYAGATSATANDQFFRALMKEKHHQPVARVVPPYFDRPSYINALAKSVETAYGELKQRPDILVCSYHGVPKRYLMEGDPYHCQCQKTTRLLKERLGWDDTEITTTFQSQFGPEDWLRPYTVDHVADLAKEGKKRIAVIAPAFSADCIETLEEINEEIKESFEHAGGEQFTYIPCLNDQPAHISALVEVIEENLSGWLSR